jgi:hypothetical protein
MEATKLGKYYFDEKEDRNNERLVIVQRNCGQEDRIFDHMPYPYRTIRGSQSYVTRKLIFERRGFPNMVVIVDFSYDPTSQSLYTQIREHLERIKVTNPFRLREIYTSIRRMYYL